ncbi:hypothetical protein CSB37_00950 [bacterium DOLZORAL124_38_8]|nr:MAG: hypothetical protein CSB37_00950 [bacterium DOLZORAL124_38_8]
MKNFLQGFVRFLSLIALFTSLSGFAFSDTVSPYQSQVTVLNSVAPADGITPIKFSGVIQNAFGTPLSNVPIKIVPSKKEVQVSASQHTNSQGQFSGNLTTNQSNIVTLNVFANEVELFDAPEVVFSLPKTAPGNSIGASGGIASFLKAQLFDDTPEEKGNTSHFSINSVKNTAQISEKLSVTVTAKDANGSVDPEYRGTIRFSVPTDPNASLPADYTFTKEDQGVHIFHLALSFNTPGEHELAVQDLDDVRIAGNFVVKIEKNEADPVVPTGPKGITITVPKNGAILSSPRVNIFGTATGCSVLTIKDGAKEIGTNIPTSPTGEYTFQTPGLSHGEHHFTALCTDEPTLVSPPVAIQIDREGPSVMKVTLSPNPVVAGKEVNIVVGSDEEISNAKFVINNEEVLLSRIDSKSFAGTLMIPDMGDYAYSASIFDTLGNEKHEAHAGVLRVSGEEVFLDTALSQNHVSEGTKVQITATAKIPLAEVHMKMNDLAIPMTKKTDFEFVGTVIAPAQGTYPFIASGISEADGTKILPRAEMALVVVDKNCKISEFPNEILPGQMVQFKGNCKKKIHSITAQLNNDNAPLETKKIDNNSFSGQFVAADTPGKNTMNIKAVFEDGSTEEVTHSFDVSEALQNAAPTSIQNLQAKPGNQKVTLFWTPAKDDQGVKNYKINYNVCGQPLTKLNITPDDRTQWYVDGLTNHVKYCFTVTPIDIKELEGPASNEAEATPAGTKNTVKQAPKSGGVDSAWVNGLIVFVIGLGFLFIKRRRES